MLHLLCFTYRRNVSESFNLRRFKHRDFTVLFSIRRKKKKIEVFLMEV